MWMYNWTNQPLVNNMPLANLLVSSSILFSGSLPSKALQVFSHLNIKIISLETFFQHQRKFLQPAVATLWRQKQSCYIAETERMGVPIVMGGDPWIFCKIWELYCNGFKSPNGHQCGIGTGIK